MRNSVTAGSTAISQRKRHKKPCLDHRLAHSSCASARLIPVSGVIWLLPGLCSNSLNEPQGSFVVDFVREVGGAEKVLIRKEGNSLRAAMDPAVIARTHLHITPLLSSPDTQRWLRRFLQKTRSDVVSCVVGRGTVIQFLGSVSSGICALSPPPHTPALLVLTTHPSLGLSRDLEVWTPA